VDRKKKNDKNKTQKIEQEKPQRKQEGENSLREIKDDEKGGRNIK
jgi:hypothetical protein